MESNLLYDLRLISSKKIPSQQHLTVVCLTHSLSGCHGPAEWTHKIDDLGSPARAALWDLGPRCSWYFGCLSYCCPYFYIYTPSPPSCLFFKTVMGMMTIMCTRAQRTSTVTILHTSHLGDAHVSRGCGTVIVPITQARKPSNHMATVTHPAFKPQCDRMAGPL